MCICAARSASATRRISIPFLLLDDFRNDIPQDYLAGYPVYVDTNVMAGHTGPADAAGRYGGLVYLPVTAENNFVPDLPRQRVDLIYLCYPNNPTGVAASKEMLQRWVDYAHQNGSTILYDAAYEAYHTRPFPFDLRN